MRTLLALALLAAGSALAAPPTQAPIWSVAVGPEAGSQALYAAGGRVITVTWDGDLVALDAKTGETRWRKAPEGPKGALDKVRVAVDGEVVVAAWPNRAELLGYALATGEVRWTRTLDAAPTSLIGCDAHRAAVVTQRSGGTLKASAFDPATGSPLWQIDADGPLVGAGGGQVFAGVPSGTGRLLKGLQTIACADGASAPVLPYPDRAFMGFLAASDGQVATHHFAFGFEDERICVTTLADQQQRTCVRASDGSTPTYPVNGAAFMQGHLVWSTSHMMAHNLDASPDSWLFALDLARSEVAWRSEPLLSAMAPLPAGGQLVSAFGSTGAEDRVYILDPHTGRALSQIPIKKAPRHLAVDEARGYVASYDGRVTAFALPKSGPKAPARAAVTPQAPAAPAPPAPDLGWHTLTTLDAHPKKARSSGTVGAGQADEVAFVDAAGTQLVVGGTDDRVRVFDLQTGKRLWISKSLGKNVEHVGVCEDGTIMARVYGGKATLFKPTKRARRWRKSRRFDPGFGWMSDVTENCRYYVAHTFGGEVQWWTTKKGRKYTSLEVSGRMDKRGMRVRAGKLVAPAPGVLRIADATDVREGVMIDHTVPTPERNHDGQLVQAWMVDGDTLLREYCGPTQCVVEFVSVPSGAVQHALRFDTQGAGWSPTVPSALDVTADGRTLFFTRLGLAPTLVDVATDRRQPIAAITGSPPGEYTRARFSKDGQRLVLAMHPKTYQVTVLARRSPGATPPSPTPAP